MSRLAPAWFILAAALFACGPRTTHDTGEWSKRQLVIHDPPDGSDMRLGISLVRAGEERAPLPFDGRELGRSPCADQAFGAWSPEGDVISLVNEALAG